MTTNPGVTTVDAERAPAYRSMLFVPGHKLDWMLKASKYGADALIFELEDAVPLDAKEAARIAIGSALAKLGGQPFGRFVRINAWGTGLTGADVSAVVQPGLDGILLAKANGPSDVLALDLVLSDLELARGLPLGRIEILPIIETALGMYTLHDMCRCSERVRRVSGGGAGLPIGGDGARALGMNFGDEGQNESILVTARFGLEARAAGITQVMGGMTPEFDDLEVVRRSALRARSFGASGSTAIHPRQVPIFNEVFSPTRREIDEARAILAAMASALARGDAAVRHNGRLIDYATARTSRDVIRNARELGLDVGEVADVALT